jgi:hypothetical protein
MGDRAIIDFPLSKAAAAAMVVVMPEIAIVAATFDWREGAPPPPSILPQPRAEDWIHLRDEIDDLTEANKDAAPEDIAALSSRFGIVGSRYHASFLEAYAKGGIEAWLTSDPELFMSAVTNIKDEIVLFTSISMCANTMSNVSRKAVPARRRTKFSEQRKYGAKTLAHDFLEIEDQP